MSLPFSGPGTPTKGQQDHHHSNTSPPVTTSPIQLTTSSGAHVVGMDIPSSPTSAVPMRSSSMRNPTNSRRELVFEGVAHGGVADSRAQGQVTRSKPRRSNSLNYHLKESGLDMSTSTSARPTQHVPSPTHQYPLRETVSLTQLQSGSLSRTGRQYGSAVAAGGESGHMPKKSSSMLTLTSSRKMRAGHTHGSMETLPSYTKDKVREI